MLKNFKSTYFAEDLQADPSAEHSSKIFKFFCQKQAKAERILHERKEGSVFQFILVLLFGNNVFSAWTIALSLSFSFYLLYTFSLFL